MSETGDSNDQPQAASSLPRSVACAEEGGEEVRRQGQQLQQQQNRQGNGHGEKRRIRKVGSMVVAPFRRINNLYYTRIKRTNKCASSSFSSFSSSFSSSSYSPSSFGSSSSRYPRYYGEPSIPRCYFCFLHPPIESDLPTVAIANDPSNPHPSTYEYVRNLIDKNDFYSVDCNVHSDSPMPTKM